MFDEFKKHYLTAFEFLENDFGFDKPKIETTKYGCFIWQKNATTGIRCGYEARDGLITLLLYRLINDEFPPHEKETDDETTINSFYFEDIIVHKLGKVPDEFWEQFDIFKNPVKNILERLAVVTRKYAADILKGDFSSFPELERIVKERVRKLKNQDEE